MNSRQKQLEWMIVGTCIVFVALFAFVTILPHIEKTIAVLLISLVLLTSNILIMRLNSVQQSAYSSQQPSVQEVREMLQDVIVNKLATIYLNAQLPNNDRRLQRIKDAIQGIESEIDSLSEESLNGWRQHYRSHFDNASFDDSSYDVEAEKTA